MKIIRMCVRLEFIKKLIETRINEEQSKLTFKGNEESY